VSTVVSGAIVETHRACKSSHYQWARSASEHDGARTKAVLRDADEIPDHANAGKFSNFGTSIFAQTFANTASL
jgi:hypothetical protein